MKWTASTKGTKVGIVMSLELLELLIRPVVPAPYPPRKIASVQTCDSAWSLNALPPFRAVRAAVTRSTTAARRKLVFIFLLVEIGLGSSRLLEHPIRARAIN